jgi:hypothetical protein
VVEKSQAVERLVAACSGFKDAWQAHREQWKGEPAGDYNDLGVLAQWVVDRMAAGDHDCFAMLFSELEALLSNASPELRDLLVVGFLEDIQNVSTNRDIDPDVVLPFLGRESRRGWFDLIRLWHGPDGTGWSGQKHDG